MQSIKENAWVEKVVYYYFNCMAHFITQMQAGCSVTVSHFQRPMRGLVVIGEVKCQTARKARSYFAERR